MLALLLLALLLLTLLLLELLLVVLLLVVFVALVALVLVEVLLALQQQLVAVLLELAPLSPTGTSRVPETRTSWSAQQ